VWTRWAAFLGSGRAGALTAVSSREVVESELTRPEAQPAAPLIVGDEPSADPVRREVRDYWFLFLASIPIGGSLVLFARLPVLYVIGGLVGFAYLLICARRPVWGCAALAFGTPLIAGLGRGTVIPLVRPSEAMLALLIVGVLVHELPTRRRRNYTTLDVAVFAYGIGVSLIPVLVLLYTGQTSRVDTTTWFNVFAPLQYVAIYFLFSRLQVTEADRRLLLNLTMAASIVVSLVGMAELANIPGVQSFVSAHWPAEGQGGTICEYGVCRPSSLLQHYSAFGAYSVLNYTIALAFLTTPGVRYSRRWLVAVLAINAIGVFISETVAAVVGLVLATVVVLLYRRTFPKQLLWVIAALVLGTVAFWGPINSRIQEQQPDQTVAGIGVPQTMGVRLQYWDQLFWPALQPAIWTGTGNVIPPEIPASLTAFVDNEYLGMAFRAGVIGEVLFLLMLATLAVMGWRARENGNPMHLAMGGMALASVFVLAVMGTTAEYLTFAGVVQIFWMVIGLFASFSVSQDVVGRRAAR
jgi:hypothetical protein